MSLLSNIKKKRNAAVLLIALLVGLASQIRAQTNVDKFHTKIYRAPYQVYFPESLCSPIKFMSQGKRYEFTLLDMSYNAGEDYLGSPQPTNAVLSDEKVIYPETFDTTDVEYVLTSGGIKEFFIVQDKPRAPADHLTHTTLDFGEIIDAGDLTMYIDGLPAPDNFTTDKAIAFVDGTRDETIFILSAPYAIDADDKIIQIHYKVHTEGNKVLVYTKTPYSWLNDPERAYPVRIDPSVTINAGYSIALEGGDTWKTTYISSGMWSGNTYRSGIDFDTTVIPDAATITKVELKLYIDDEGGSLNNDIGRMTSSAQTYNTANNKSGFNFDVDGNEYLSNSAGFDGVNSYHTVELLSAAATDLQNQLGADWFSVGWTGTTEVNSNYRDGHTYLEANPPQIIVTYVFALTGVSNSPSPNTVSDIATHTISFTTSKDLSSDGRIVITFPDGFDISDVTNDDITSDTMDGDFSTDISGQVLTITRVGGGSDQIADDENIIIANIINTAIPDNDYTITVETQDGNGDTINEPTESEEFAILSWSCENDYFSYQRSIVIDHEKVGTDNSGTLPATGFPVLIDISADWLKTTTVDADNGRIESNSGNDIIFKQDSTFLFHEIEEYDATSGHLVAWVRVDSLSKATDTTITMLYGNECSSATEYPEYVWDPNFAGVWHLKELDDSTSNNNDGTTYNGTAEATGKISKAYQFDGDDDQLVCGGGENLDNVSPLTFTAWIKQDGEADIYPRIFEKRSASAECKTLYSMDNHLKFIQKTDATEVNKRISYDLTDDIWHHVAVTWDGTLNESGINLYYDCSLAPVDLSQNGTGTALDDSGGGLWIGCRHTTDRTFWGIIDEFRLSNKVRSADWLVTEYNNQSDTTIGEGYFIKYLGIEKVVCTFFYRRAIAIDHTKVGIDNNGALPETGFPVLIDISGDWLKTMAEDPVNGCIEDEDGDDIIFRASNGKTGLYHEIEDYDGTNGSLVAWVRIDSLSKETDTTIYMYYGNACITDPTEEPENVWDPNFVGVWHLNEQVTDNQTGDSHYDSTSNDNDGTQYYNGPGTGRIGGAQDFDGDGDYIDLGNSSTLMPSSITVSAWAKREGSSDGQTWQDIVGNQHWDTGGYLLFLDPESTGVSWRILSSGTNDTINASATTSGWHFYCGTFSGSTSRVYVDGILENTDPIADMDMSVNNIAIGDDAVGSGQGLFDGLIDEVRISKVARDADWIATCYNNQMWPNKDATDDGFITVGDVEDNFCTFSYRNLITIDCAGISADLSDFPFLFDVTDDHLRYVDDGGYITHASGYDIVFRSWNVSACGGYAPCDLPHEIEEYNATSGHLTAWVKIPTLSGDTSTDIYIYYGSECVTEPTENPAEVWNENYIGVWHLSEDTDATNYDSTANSNDGAPSGSPAGTTAGKIAGALTFDGVNDYVSLDGQDIEDHDYDAVTVVAWYKSSDSTVGAPSGIDDEYIYTHMDSGWNEFINMALTDDTGHQGQVRIEASVSGTYNNVYSTTNVVDQKWHHLAMVRTGGGASSRLKVYVDGDEEADGADSSGGEVIYLSSLDDGPFFGDSPGDTERVHGILDELRISTTARSASWIATEYNNQSSPSTFCTYDPNSYESGEYGRPTAVSLSYFRAEGEQDGTVMLSWETAQEIDNLGFYLYRAENPYGPFARITDKMIPGLSFSVQGKKYAYRDTKVTPCALYYYKLEDIEIGGKRIMHGPICVDWDGDGIPDDWEIAYGLDPMLDDSRLDPDGDGLTNLEEYEQGTDPLNPDTDGDGICDGDEGLWIDHQESPFASKHVKQPLKIISSDDTGITLELHTEAFESEKIIAEDKNTYDRLRIRDYIHGFTSETGWPELPFKGVLLDLPEGVDVTLVVIGTESTIHHDYWVYPHPEKVASTEGGIDEVTEIFTIDEAVYSADTPFPHDISRCGSTYIFRGQRKLHLLFYPLAFNPAARELTHISRIMVRVNFKKQERKSTAERAAVLRARPSRARAWTPPTSEAFYKIILADEGIYRLDKGYLEGKGVPVGEIDLRTLRLYNLGREVALYIYDKDGDNLLDFGDYNDFYGKPIDEQYAKYTNNNVYFLITEGGEGEPKRMVELEAAPAGGAVPATYTDTIHYEQDQYYLLMLPGGDSLDRWVFSTAIQGEGIEWVDQNTPAPGSIVPFTLTLPGVTGAGSVTVCMWGLGENEHEVEIYCNDVYLSTVTWEGIASYQASLSGVDLVSGSNTVGIKCNGETDVIAVDWFEASYPRSFTADNDQLSFTLTAGSRGLVSGFSQSDLLLYDITSPDEAKVVLNFTVMGAAEPYTLDFEPQYDASVSGEMTFFVLSQGAQKLPLSLSANTPAHLTDTSNGADYLVITHRNIGWDLHGELYPWLSELAALRQSQGLRVKVIDVDTIYNEFAYGFPTPQALKDFLEFAYESWSRPAPRYVLLLGDSTYDYKNNLNAQEHNFSYLPAYLSSTRVMGEGPSDDWFVMLEGGDDIPDMHIGRLPAVNAEQAEVMVNKILAYEDALNSKSWEKNVLFVADNQNNDDEESFEIMSEDSSALVPPNLNAPFKAYLDNYYSASGLKGEIKAKINEGSLMVNYSGHGSTQVWGMESIFNNQDVPDLTNERMLPFFVSMTCLTGYFIYPESWSFPCMAEALLRAGEGGAISAFMSAAMTDPKGQHVLDTAVFDALFTEDVRTLGPAITLAKQTLLANQFGPEPEGGTFLLFGDPAMSLKVPIPRKPLNLKVEAEPGPEGGVMLSWDEALDCDGEPVFAYNLYRSTTPDGEYSLVSPYIPYWLLPYEENLGKSDTTYYYVLTSVDFDGDESVRSRSVSGRTGTIPRSEPKQANPWDTYIVTGTVTIVDGPSTSQDSSNLGKGCFISTLFSYDRSDKASIIN